MTGEVDTQQVAWAIASLAPGERRTFSFVTRVSARAIDGENLKNVFQMVSTELPQPTSSNEVSTPVWSAKLLIEKQVSAQEVTYGERLTYTLHIRNTSETTPVVDAVITDTPARGLEYIPGTSTLGGSSVARVPPGWAVRPWPTPPCWGAASSGPSAASPRRVKSSSPTTPA